MKEQQKMGIKSLTTIKTEDMLKHRAFTRFQNMQPVSFIFTEP